MINKKILILIVLFLGVGVYLLAGSGGIKNRSFQRPVPDGASPDFQPPAATLAEVDQEIILTNLNIPWEIGFLPSGQILITQRPGTLLLVDENQEKIEVDGVRHIGEGGLLGLAVHSDFEENNWIYLYLTSEVDGVITNRVERYQLIDNQLTDRTIIIDNIPGAAVHDGGRIKFGPDGYLFITTGDAGEPDLAQNQDSLAGKILRLEADGSIPDDNPFGNEVWSLGHRNPQGLTWDEQERLWATEHGRSGVQSGYDELNLIEPGENYGWPVIQGPEERQGMVAPVIQSGPDTTWAPAGAEFFQGSIYFAGLRGSRLYQYQIETGQLAEHLVDKYGRLRAVSLYDGYLYLSTSNTDGRGDPIDKDDRIIKINPDIL